MVPKGPGESFAHNSTEKANPGLDLWFGGTGDPQPQAAALGRLEVYQSPRHWQPQPWAPTTS